MKTYLVTGAAGFIGANFIKYMLAEHQDIKIVVLDLLTYAGNLSTLKEALKNPNFRFCKINICDRDAIFQLFEEEHPDVVVNFAAESHVDRSIENPEVFLDTNIKGTAVLMDACRKYGIQRSPGFYRRGIRRSSFGSPGSVLYRGDAASHQQSLQLLQGSCRSSGTGIPPHLRPSDYNQPLL